MNPRWRTTAGGLCRETAARWLVRDGFFREQIVPQFVVERRVLSPNPLQDHRGVFFFFVSVVSQDCLELIVLTRINPLVVPIYCCLLYTSDAADDSVLV